MLISGDEDGLLVAWDPDARRIRWERDLGRRIEALAWRSEGDLLAVATGNYVRLYSPRGRDFPLLLALNTKEIDRRLLYEVRSLAFSPDKNWLAVGRFDGSLMIFKSTKDKGEGEYQQYSLGRPHILAVNTICFVPGEKAGDWKLATGGGDGIVRLIPIPSPAFLLGLDPARIESIKVNYGGGSVELQKVKNAWQVAGKADAKVNTESLNDVLAALGDLKSERSLLAGQAELKRYGLDVPLAALEVKASGSKATLDLGAQEGGSKSRYAHVYAAGRTKVFLLDETTSTKLLRAMAGLTGKD